MSPVGENHLETQRPYRSFISHIACMRTHRFSQNRKQYSICDCLSDVVSFGPRQIDCLGPLCVLRQKQRGIMGNALQMQYL